MKILPSDRSYSWLQWPVTLLNCKEPDLHITAKYFGNAIIDPKAVQNRCNGGIYLPRKKFRWVPRMFGVNFVLEFVSYPPSLEYIHDTFDIIREAFPVWRPHITVPQKYWSTVAIESWTPQSEELSLGEMELFVRGDILEKYHAVENTNRPD